jgi:hypothetical protein
LVNNASDRGISILIKKGPGEFRFYLHSCAVTKEDELLLAQHQLSLPTKGNLTLSCTTGLRYCPFCGTPLQTLVKVSSFRRFEALAEEHKKIHE